MYINRVQLYGNLTRDPEVKALPSGSQVANFSVATNRTWKDKETGKQEEQVEYHNCVAFGRTAEVIGQYMKKGKPILIDGRIQTRSWEKDGVKQYRTEIIVETFQFGPSPKDGGSAPRAAAPDEDPLAKEFEEGSGKGSDEDIPF